MTADFFYDCIFYSLNAGFASWGVYSTYKRVFKPKKISYFAQKIIDTINVKDINKNCYIYHELHQLVIYVNSYEKTILSMKDNKISYRDDDVSFLFSKKELNLIFKEAKKAYAHLLSKHLDTKKEELAHKFNKFITSL